jgi:hypothetical protein
MKACEFWLPSEDIVDIGQRGTCWLLQSYGRCEGEPRVISASGW